MKDLEFDLLFEINSIASEIGSGFGFGCGDGYGDGYGSATARGRGYGCASGFGDVNGGGYGGGIFDDIEIFSKSEYKNLLRVGYYFGTNKIHYSESIYKSYEGALEAGLQEGLKLI